MKIVLYRYISSYSLFYSYNIFYEYIFSISSLMMECESYNLNWAEFTSYTSKTFNDLLHNEDFADVTLVCDDDESIKAHKVILSACSPFFNRILRKNHHNHPLIYLSDVNLNELKAIVNFIYLGQTNVEQDNLQRFLKVAAKFQVRGLTDNKTEEQTVTTPSKEANKSPKKIPGLNKTKQSIIQTPELQDNSMITHESQPNSSNISSGDIKIEAEPVEGDPVSIFDDNDDLDNVDNFDSIDTSQFAIENMMSLAPTIVSADGDKMYPCDQCDYKATYACNLTSHKRTVHQGLYYSCNLCPYKSSRKDRLNKHYVSKHNNFPSM